MRSIFFIFLCIVLLSSLKELDKYVTYKGGNNKANIIQKKPIYIKEYKKKENIFLPKSEYSSTDIENSKSQIAMPESYFYEFLDLSDVMANSYNISSIRNENLNFNCKTE